MASSGGVEVGISNYTFGSDAHELDRAGYLSEVLAIAEEVGITHVSTFKGRVATRHLLT